MPRTETYNGWTNYATWRVNLEFFDGWDADGNPMDAANCRQTVEEFVDEAFDAKSGQGNIIAGWVNAFLSDVNWDEISKAVNEANGIEEGDDDAR